MRDERGEMIYDLGRYIAEGTNTEEEATAIVEALRYCRMHNYNYIWLETDSMLLKKHS